MERLDTEQVPLVDDWHLPLARPDESVYSWCARFHRLNLEYDPRDTSKLLFGHRSAGLRHDIPFCLGTFAQRTRSCIGNADELLVERTLLGFHVRFLTDDAEREVLDLFRGHGSSKGRGKLGLKKFGQDSSSLRYCPDCTEEQRAVHGHTWWRMPHQLPGTFYCDIHQQRLQTATVVQYRGVIQGFFLPELPACAGSHDPSIRTRRRLQELSEWAAYIWRRPNLRLTDDILRWCYRFRAQSRGWTALDGSVRLNELRDEFADYYGDALEAFDCTMLGDLGGVNCGFLAYLMRNLPGHRHPTKHLLLLNFLFDSFAAFEAVMETVLSVLGAEGVAGCERRLLESRAALVRLVGKDGFSVTRAASQVGISLSSAARFIDTQRGVERDRRARIVGTAKEALLLKWLEQGLSRGEIASTLGIRRSFIKDYLGQRPEVRQLWEEANRELQQRKHREQLLAALREHPDLPIKAIRRLPGNGFQWLYNNDRDWLMEILPALWRR